MFWVQSDEVRVWRDFFYQAHTWLQTYMHCKNYYRIPGFCLSNLSDTGKNLR
jgi:hypothetical protein